MYFVQYTYEIIGDYSVEEEMGTIILNDLGNDMDDIMSTISSKTNRSVLSIVEIQPLKNEE